MTGAIEKGINLWATHPSAIGHAVDAYQWVPRWPIDHHDLGPLVHHAIVEDLGPGLPALGRGYDHVRDAKTLCKGDEKTIHIETRHVSSRPMQRCGLCIHVLEARVVRRLRREGQYP